MGFAAAASEGDGEAPLSVGELIGLVSNVLDRDFAHVLVSGELTAVKRATSGHLYFTLSDDDGSIDAVLWRSDALRLAFQPRQGDEVLCRGRIGVFARQGRMQLYATAMKPVGAGAAQRAVEERRRRLAAEGLFDPARKRALPFLPRAVGVVTSSSGAALHDILVTLQRRFPGVPVLLSPTPVQGAEAPAGIVAALALLARDGRCDVAIVGRGGGAAEDLAAFNDEAVVRAVAAFPVPVVSAVGHEVDVTLCDLAADLRAATPTAAAEAVVPVRRQVLEQVETGAHRLASAALRRLAGWRTRVDAVGGRLRHPEVRAVEGRRRLDAATVRLERAMQQKTGRASAHLAALASSLGALSPLAVLERGYSLAADAGGRLVRDAGEVHPGERLSLRFHRGRADVEVVRVEAAPETRT